MIRIISFLLLVAATLSCVASPSASLDPNINFSPDEAAGVHTVQMYHYAGRLLEAEEMNEAAFWFYAGQLRYRVHLMARPNLPPDQDAAVFASLNSVLGQEVNQYIGGDPAEWEDVIERVLNWDAQTPNDFTPKDKFPSAHRQVRAGLQEMWTWIHENHDEIREQRTASGLENR